MTRVESTGWFPYGWFPRVRHITPEAPYGINEQAERPAWLMVVLHPVPSAKGYWWCEILAAGLLSFVSTHSFVYAILVC